MHDTQLMVVYIGAGNSIEVSHKPGSCFFIPLHRQHKEISVLILKQPAQPQDCRGTKTLVEKKKKTKWCYSQWQLSRPNPVTGSEMALFKPHEKVYHSEG